MDSGKSRLDNEQKTVEAMVALYCHAHHGKKKGLCNACKALVTYARQRLTRCPFQHNKPTCGKCPIHCYKPDLRMKIQEVMRYAGPRMLRHHPVLAIRHLFDRLRKVPQLPRKDQAGKKQA